MVRKTGSGDPRRTNALDAPDLTRHIDGADHRTAGSGGGEARRGRVSPAPRCADCGGRADRTLARYVRRRSFVRLRVCGSCELVWADPRFAPTCEGDGPRDAGKKSERLSSEPDRAPVRTHLAELVCSRASPGSSVLEVAGGRGHVLSRVRDRRPDLCLVLQDPSATACRYAESHFGLATLRGDLGVLESLSRPFDVEVLDEVLGFVPDLSRVWRVLEHVVADGGTLILRMATRPSLVRLGAALERAAVRLGRGEPPAGIPFLDPDQLYVMTPDFLAKRLGGLGFGSVRTLPAPSPRDSAGMIGGVRGMGFCAAGLLHRATRGRVSVTPSFAVIAERSR